jgi:glycosyltransferase involved in cell wall biosynthesis
MKVLHVIPSISPVRGGPSYAVLETVKALRNLGIESEIVTTNDHGPNEVLDVPLAEITEYGGVPVCFFSRFAPPAKGVTFNTDRAFLFSGDLTKWLWQHTRNYDLLETRYLFSYPSSCARIIAQIQKVPYIVHPTGQLAAWALSQSRKKKQIYSFLIERRNLNRASAIQCSSAGEAKDIYDFKIKTPTFVAPVGVTSTIELPAAKQKLRDIYHIPVETPVVLFLSRIHPKKRPDLLVTALSQLAQQNYDFHLILAGTGEPDYLSYLKNSIASLGLASRISFAGFVAGEDKYLLLQGSDLFVLPSFSENFGVAVAEAMAAGLPAIVTSGIQIAPEIAAANAGLAIEGDVDSLAGAIAQLLDSPDLREKLGNNGKILARGRYSWQAIAKDLVTVYQSIVQQKTLPPDLAVRSF